jgi:REP element-mobilizing transposase RayT
VHLRGRWPVHVTLRRADGLPSLRTAGAYRALLDCMDVGGERFGMRLVHWAVMSNHVHLLVEAGDRLALSRGMQGLAVRMARALNRLWGRKGRVFADRYHSRTLPSPSQVRTALAYVLQNAQHHDLPTGGADPCSSAAWFDGWHGGGPALRSGLERPAWLRTPRTWLLAHGWRRLGLLVFGSLPSGP